MKLKPDLLDQRPKHTISYPTVIEEEVEMMLELTGIEKDSFEWYPNSAGIRASTESMEPHEVKSF